MTNRMKPLHGLLVLALLLAGSACQPRPRVESQGDYVLQITQIDTSRFPMVDVYISVRDAAGEPRVININKLQLLENGQPVSDALLQGEVGALTSLLLIDNSGSMNFAGKLESAKAAANDYIQQMREGDQAGIITFNTQVELAQPVTSQRSALTRAVDGIRAQADTALYDALVQAVEMLNPLPGRKAIIVLTDGMDNQSKATVDEALEGIGFSGLSISTIGFGEIPSGAQEADAYSGIDEDTLGYIAQNAGGRYAYAANQQELAAIYDQMRRALQSEVVLSYRTPLSLRDGVKRALTVTLSDAYRGLGGQSQSGYNPGGLVPEVAQPAAWTLFGGLLLGLGLLLAAPLLWLALRNRKPKKRKIKITLKD